MWHWNQSHVFVTVHVHLYIVVFSDLCAINLTCYFSENSHCLKNTVLAQKYFLNSYESTRAFCAKIQGEKRYIVYNGQKVQTQHKRKLISKSNAQKIITLPYLNFINFFKSTFLHQSILQKCWFAGATNTLICRPVLYM